MAFTFWDYAVVISTLFISASIGIYYRLGDKNKNNEAYLLGDRKQKWLPVAFSLMASFMSAVSILGGSGEAYAYGTHFFITNIGYCLGAILSMTFYMPVFFKLETVSVYKYLELRFCVSIRRCASLAYCLQTILYTSVVLVTPAIAFEALTNGDISREMSIVVIGVVCTFYSAIGGMKAVIATDVFQSLLMFGSVFSVIFTVMYEAGGFNEIWETAKAGGRVNLTDFRLDPTVRHTWLSVIVGGIFTNVILNGINQTQVQRYMTMKDVKTIVNSTALSMILLCSLSVSICIAGLCIFYKYRQCDPIRSGLLRSEDQLLPYYVANTFGSVPGLAGLFIAGIFSASLSTISASLNSLAAVALEDYIKPIMKSGHDGNSKITQILSTFFGLVCVAVAFGMKDEASVLQMSLTIFGAVGGPLLGLFSLGIFAPIANQIGASCGFIAGLLFTAWISFGGPRPPKFPLPTRLNCSSPSTPVPSGGFFNSVLDYFLPSTLETFLNDGLNTLEQNLGTGQNYPFLFRVSYMYYGFLGFAVTAIVGLGISFMAYKCGKRDAKDARLFSPPVATCVKSYRRRRRNRKNIELEAEQKFRLQNGDEC